MRVKVCTLKIIHFQFDSNSRELNRKSANQQQATFNHLFLQIVVNCKKNGRFLICIRISLFMDMVMN